LTQADLLEIATIFAERLFGIRPAFAIIPKHLGHFAAVHLLEVFDTGDDGHKILGRYLPSV
jgi:hypothetical protein